MPDRKAVIAEDRKGDYKAALENVIHAWEALEGGCRVGVPEIEEWLSEDMAVAINKARVTLGREPNKRHRK